MTGFLFESSLWVSVGVFLVAVALIGFFGTVIGMVAGYAGGATETVLMRMADMVMVMPTLADPGSRGGRLSPRSGSRERRSRSS